VSTEESKDYKLHAIQLRELRVIELYIKSRFVQENGIDSVSPENFLLSSGHGKYDDESHIIAVNISAKIGQENQSFPYNLHVELLGIFEVDPERFPIVHIEDWAKRNAPLVLYPYLREHVYALTLRAEVGPVLLPLFEIPTFRVINS
jgi:preprotein translocase subunit SecB